MTSVPAGLFIDGEWRATSERFEVIDPAELSPLAQVSDASETDASDAVAAAHAAFPAWAASSPRSRSEVLRRAYELMVAEQEYGALLIAQENGKALRDARAEVLYAAEFFRWFAEEAVRVPGDFRTAPAGDKTIVVDHRPVGVTYMITPWNFPAAMATRKLAPALAAGCTCILKPAAETPLTALWLADLLHRAGAPAGTVNVLPTTRPAHVSDRVLSDPRVSMLSFTGSTAVGRLLLRSVADRVLKVAMELGGNAPFVILEGTDVDAAVEAAMVAKMRNGGSACTAANRFYVHESLVDRFTGRFEDALSRLVIGPGVQASTELGAMVSERERNKIHQLLTVAEAEGGRVSVLGDVPARGAFVAPTLVRSVEHGSILTLTEVFGPVAPIVSFEQTEDAIRMANDTEYGLISYVFGPDAGSGLKVARRMEAGMVAVNRGGASDPAAPFGGVKQSGLGREGGFAGIHEYLEPQYLAVDL
jgi:succinate-semialdehyde dehydrogenase/glutarate-semialdehyde dehydrogenase